MNINQRIELNRFFLKSVYRFFDKNKHLKIPNRLNSDTSKNCLVMIWSGANDWYVLAFMTKNMIDFFKKVDQTSHHHYIIDIIIEDIDKQSEDILCSYMAASPYEDNTYFIKKLVL